MQLDDFCTLSEAAKKLDVKYFTLLSWVNSDVGEIKTKGLVVKKTGWLVHKKAIVILQKLLVDRIIFSRKP